MISVPAKPYLSLINRNINLIKIVKVLQEQNFFRINEKRHSGINKHHLNLKEDYFFELRDLRKKEIKEE